VRSLAETRDFVNLSPQILFVIVSCALSTPLPKFYRSCAFGEAMFSVVSPTPYAFHPAPNLPLTPRCANATPVRMPSDSIIMRKPGIRSSPLSGHTTLSPRLEEEFYTPQQTFRTPQPQTRRRVDPRQQMLQSADEKRGLRRNGFLQKIKGQRDEKRWDARGEQVGLKLDQPSTPLTSADLVRRLSQSAESMGGGTSTKSARSQL